MYEIPVLEFEFFFLVMECPSMQFPFPPQDKFEFWVFGYGVMIYINKLNYNVELGEY